MAEDILHFVSVKARVTGRGNMQMTLYSLDDTRSIDLLALPVQNNGIEPTRLTNFRSQRARLKIYTTKINEHLEINRIVVYAKPSAKNYPM